MPGPGRISAIRLAISREGGWILWNLGVLALATWREIRGRWVLALGLLVLAAGSAAVAGMGDSAVSAWANDRQDDPWRWLAGRIRTFGAFTDVLTWSALLLLAGRIAGRERWRRLGLACLLGALLAGGVANLFRPTLGRARPDTEVGVFTLRAFALRPQWQSLPSGHTATSTGGGLTLLVLCPPVGIIPAIQGLAVGAASVRLNRHWLSDVVGGLGLGVFAAVFVTLAVRRLDRDEGWSPGPLA